MNTKHTPGPWAARPQRVMRAVTIEAAGRIPICVTTGSASKAEHEANARLIAAAPELLAALRQLVKDADDNRKSLEVWHAAHPHLEAARAAIAKVTWGAA